MAEVAPVARTQAFGRDAREGQAREAHDREARRLAHTADLLVASLAQRDFEPRLAALVAHVADLGRQGLAVFELHAGLPNLQIALGHLALHLDDVGLRDVLLGVEQRVRELTVVGEQQGAAGVKVEPADGVQTGTRPRDQIGDGLAAFGIRKC